MKKSLVALAVLAASGAAMAQSNVTLYGIADVWFGSSKFEVTGEDSARQTKVDSGGVDTSRWGMKGSEDLGGGLKANFQLESAVNMDDGTSTGFDRQAWVGLSGGFGAVQLGKVWTSYDDIRSSANDTFNANIASSFSTWVGYSDRTDNGIKYISPNYGGVSGSLTYALGEDKTPTNSASSVLALGLQYANGPLFVGFSHQQQKQNGVNGVFSAVPGFLSSELGEALTVDLLGSSDVRGKTTYNLLNGSYDFGVAKLVGGYNHVKQTINDEAVSAKAKEYNLGVEVPLATNLKAGLGYASSKIEADGTDVAKTTGFSAAVIYNLSKRTAVYGALTQTKLEDQLGSDFEIKKTLYAVGMNHSF
ncbi:MAG: porin [Rhodoferax sp.]|nr:porin [Rhodoferax sp.]